MLHTEALDHVNVTSRADAESSAASRLIDRRLAALTDWRGQVLSTIRSIIRSADPRVGEDWKWRGVPVWACNGIICTGDTYCYRQDDLPHGASLSEPSGLFNASLDGATRRAIDLREGEDIDEDALLTLIRSAIVFNDVRVARRRQARAE